LREAALAAATSFPVGCFVNEGASVAVNCSNCGTQLVGAFCHACGQSARPPRTGFGGFLAEIASGALGTDLRLLRTLRRLVLSPGGLTLDWIAGRRVLRTGPVQLYLLLATVFFVINAYHPFIRFDPEDLSIRSTLTGVLVDRTLGADQLSSLRRDGISLAVFKERFDRRVSAVLAPFLLLVVILFALLVALVMRRRGHPFAHHGVFALHWCAFYLLLESLHRLVGAGTAVEVVVGFAGVGYLMAATGRVYGGWRRALAGGIGLYIGFAVFLALWMQTVMLAALPRG
jgi:hypothetical protein